MVLISSGRSKMRRASPTRPGRYADGRRLMESALAASPEPDRDALLWWPCDGRSGGEADQAHAARRRRRQVDVDEAVAIGRRFVDVLLQNGHAAIDDDGSGPLVRAELAGAEAEAERLEGQRGS